MKGLYAPRDTSFTFHFVQGVWVISELLNSTAFSYKTPLLGGVFIQKLNVFYK